MALTVFEIGRGCECGCNRMVVGQAWSIRLERLYPWVCVDCGKTQTQYCKKAVALAEAAKNGGELPEVTTATQRLPEKFAELSAEALGSVCEVCGAGNTQYHHWAPWHLFGPEAENWPGADLCQSCHTKWHQIVTPNMGNHKAGF